MSIAYNENLYRKSYKLDSQEFYLDTMNHLLISPVDRFDKKSQLIVAYDCIKRDNFELTRWEHEFNEHF